MPSSADRQNGSNKESAGKALAWMLICHHECLCVCNSSKRYMGNHLCAEAAFLADFPEASGATVGNSRGTKA